MPANETKADIIRVYRVVSDPTNPYLAEYRVIWQKSVEIAVVPKRALFQREQPLSIRRVERIMRDHNRPERWDDLALILAKHRYAGPPDRLSASDAALGGVRADVDPRLPTSGVQVFGIQFSAAQFILSVGWILAAIAFAMLGPLIALRRAKDKHHTQPWVIVLSSFSGLTRSAFETILAFLTYAWAISPLILFGVHIAAYLKYASTGIIWMSLSGFGYVFASAIYLLVTRELRILRVHNDVSG